MTVYSLSIRRWEDGGHECDCNIPCPEPENHWELIGVYTKEEMVKMLTQGFPNPDHGDIAVPSQYSTEDFGCFSTHYDYGYYQVLPWLTEVNNG